jgi:hypothetical protein
MEIQTVFGIPGSAAFHIDVIMTTPVVVSTGGMNGV